MKLKKLLRKLINDEGIPGPPGPPGPQGSSGISHVVVIDADGARLITREEFKAKFGKLPQYPTEASMKRIVTAGRGISFFADVIIVLALWVLLFR